MVNVMADQNEAYNGLSRMRKLAEQRCPKCRVRLMEEYDQGALVQIICPNTACDYLEERQG
jgi:hypothetical protein